MSVRKVVIPIDRLPPWTCPPVAVVPYNPARDQGPVGRLVGRCAAASGLLDGPANTSIEAELASRPGRTVWGWVARSVETSDPAAIMGMVSLVVVDGGPAPRCSIGWLFVDPAHRRRGVGRALVATAARQAHMLGAADIHAETLDRWPAAVGFWKSIQ